MHDEGRDDERPTVRLPGTVLAFAMGLMLVHVDATGSCDACGNPRGGVHILADRTDRCITLCIACLRAMVRALKQASGKLERDSAIVPRTIPSGISDQDKQKRDHYLAVIKRQSQQMIELGFLGLPSAEWLAHTESELAKLDLLTPESSPGCWELAEACG